MMKKHKGLSNKTTYRMDKHRGPCQHTAYIIKDREDPVQNLKDKKGTHAHSMDPYTRSC